MVSKPQSTYLHVSFLPQNALTKGCQRCDRIFLNRLKRIMSKSSYHKKI